MRAPRCLDTCIAMRQGKPGRALLVSCFQCARAHAKRLSSCHRRHCAPRLTLDAGRAIAGCSFLRRNASAAGAGDALPFGVLRTLLELYGVLVVSAKQTVSGRRAPHSFMFISRARTRHCFRKACMTRTCTARCRSRSPPTRALFVACEPWLPRS